MCVCVRVCALERDWLVVVLIDCLLCLFLMVCVSVSVGVGCWLLLTSLITLRIVDDWLLATGVCYNVRF